MSWSGILIPCSWYMSWDLAEINIVRQKFSNVNYIKIYKVSDNCQTVSDHCQTYFVNPADCSLRPHYNHPLRHVWCFSCTWIKSQLKWTLNSLVSGRHCCNFNSLALREMIIYQVYLTNSFHKLISWSLSVKLDLGDCHWTPLMIIQHWFK